MKQLLFIMLAFILMSSDCTISFDINDDIDEITQDLEPIKISIESWDMVNMPSWSIVMLTVDNILGVDVNIYNDYGLPCILGQEFIFIIGNTITLYAPSDFRNDDFDDLGVIRGDMLITNYN